MQHLELSVPTGAPLVAAVAGGLRLRLVGLAGLATAPRAGLLIPGCRSIHTWGMRFALDVVFLEWPPARGIMLVREVRLDVRPCRFVLASRRSHRLAALELAAGRARRLGLDGPGTAVTVI